MKKIKATIIHIIMNMTLVLNVAANENISYFDTVYKNILYETAPNNIENAIIRADSLYMHSSKSIEKVKSLLLLSMLYNSSGNIVSSFEYALAAEKEASTTNNLEWQMRVKGMISDRFLSIGLNHEGYKYLLEIEKINKKEKNTMVSLFVIQNKIFFYLKEHDLKNAKEQYALLEKMNVAITSPSEESIVLATTYLLKGMISAQENNLIEAAENFDKAKLQFETNSETLSPFVYVNLIKLNLELGEIEPVKKYLDKIEQYNAANIPEIRIEISQLKSRYYHLINQPDSALLYENLYSQQKIEHLEFLKILSNEILKRNYYKEKNTDRNYKYTSVMFTLMLCGVSIIGILVIFQNRKNTKKYLKIIDAYKNFHQSQNDENSRAQQKNKALLDVSHSSELVPENTVNRILERLNEFEKSNLYLDNEFSLSKLAILVDTNVKYLSYTINKYKNKEFNIYINELRISYIVNLLLNQPEYLEYKIAYLAELSGFSSHSRFSQIFRKVTGVSPSVFINKTKKELKRF